MRPFPQCSCKAVQSNQTPLSVGRNFDCRSWFCISCYVYQRHDVEGKGGTRVTVAAAVPGQCCRAYSAFVRVMNFIDSCPELWQLTGILLA